MPQRRLHLVIKGVVQGVCYRLHTQREAQRLGLRGWVRNLRDGSVELTAEGPEPELEALGAWCGQGPPAARVSSLEPRWSEASGEFTGFEIRR